MVPVAAAAAAGWPVLFLVLLLIPPREEDAAPGPVPGTFDPRSGGAGTTARSVSLILINVD